MKEIYQLYAIPHSLYAGRARSYLIKSGTPFRELSSGHESFKAEILPKAKLATIPVILTPAGEVIRDGAMIIEHFEANNGRAFMPKSPKQQIVSALFDLIGTDGLLRPAMHYRWNFPVENEQFLHYHFFHSQRLTDTREEKTRYMMGRMQTAGQLFGANESAFTLIEQLYLEVLNALNNHFEKTPYLLGWKPSLGDFGLLAPLYAHLGRDPMPANLMKQKAICVYRWVERMNRPDQDAAEFFNAGDDYLNDDEVPQTLIDVLKVIAEDLLPETQAAAGVINQWLDENQPEQGRVVERFFEKAEFQVRGQTLQAITQSYRFVMLQQVQDLFEKLDVKDQQSVKALLADCGLAQLLGVRLQRRLGWSENQSIWL